MKVKFEIHDLRKIAYLLNEASEKLKSITNILDRIYLDSEMVEEDEGSSITDNHDIKVI